MERIDLINAVNQNDLENIYLYTKQILEERDDEVVEYYYAYSLKETKTEKLIAFFEKRIVSRSNVITIYNHILKYLKDRKFQKYVEVFLINNTSKTTYSLDIYLNNYYEKCLGIPKQETKTNYEAIVFTRTNIYISKYVRFVDIDKEYRDNEFTYYNLYQALLACKVVIFYYPINVIFDECFKNLVLFIEKKFQIKVHTTYKINGISQIVKKELSLISILFIQSHQNYCTYLIKPNTKIKKFPRSTDDESIEFYINNERIDESHLFTRYTKVVAKEHLKKYKVQVFDYDTFMYSIDVECNHQLGKLPEFTKEGYTVKKFLGNQCFTKNFEIDENFIVNTDIIITYHYFVTLTYICDDEIIKSSLQEYDNEISKYPIMNNYGDAVRDWYIDKELKIPWKRDTIVKTDLTLYTKSFTHYLFGSYPQVLVTKGKLIEELNKVTKEDANGYILYENNYYKKIIASPKEEKQRFCSSPKEIIPKRKYYFLVQKIKWRVIQESDDYYILLSENILDAHNYFSPRNEYREINGELVYPSNYEFSKIRYFLNNNFLNCAFDDEEKKQIIDTLVDNSLKTTRNEIKGYACNNTLDKVYLLSYSDLQNSDYGFLDDNDCPSKYGLVTDYALARGCEIRPDTFYGSWWLRSPNYKDSVNMVNFNSRIWNDDYVDNESQGVRPVIKVLKKNKAALDRD